MNESEYLEHRFEIDKATVKEVQAQADNALRTLEKTYVKGRGWPYALVEGESIKAEDQLSHSTTAMILHSVAVAYGVISSSVLVPAVRTGTGKKRDPDKVMPVLQGGLVALADSSDTTGGGLITTSNTWGPNDPLTLTWFYELLNAGLLAKSRAEKLRAKIKRVAEEQLDKIADNPESVLEPSGHVDDYPVHHPFLLLRWVQLARAVGATGVADLPKSKLPTAFLNLLRGELSNSAIRDGGFDPACLVFALEGLVTINAAAITEAMLDQVVDVLSSTPSVATHWRPVRPMSATARGRILLPQSVEVANSYLRLCNLDFAQRITVEPLFTRSFEVLQSYTDWLLSRTYQVRVKPNNTNNVFLGWQSEHTYQANVIHLWATSQVVLFLQHFSAMLQQHIARTSRIAGNLDFRPPETAEDQAAEVWEKKQKQKREPMFGLTEDNVFRAYNRIDKSFVQPRLLPGRNKGQSYSMLLYGPPGTGKTSFAKAMAEALHYDRIIVSPSDFIRGGEADVEARAKRIFDVLKAQTNVVILFDEIDRLILDRDSPEYNKQADMFQFMTPSMLTKINDLREEKRSIFVIATNYAERIDSAIKRRGRIDEQIVLLPPDLARRTEIIADCAGDIDFKELKRKPSAARLARKTPLYIYSELEFLVQTVADNMGPGKTVADASEIALKQARGTTISLASYKRRFFPEDAPFEPGRPRVIDADRTPWTEFALLAYLKAEVGQTLELDWAPQVLDQPSLLERLDAEIATKLHALLAKTPGTA